MSPTAEPQTFVAFVTVCARCKREVQGLRARTDGPAIIQPCGHQAEFLVIPNPELSPQPH